MRAIGIAIFALLVSAQAQAQAPSPIVGEYIEARSGYVYTCGCVYSGEQVTGGREAILAWRFRTGEFRGTSLTGMKAAAVAVGDGHLGMEGTPRRSVLYLDDSGSEAQRQAALELLLHEYKEVLGDLITVHTAPISFQSKSGQLIVGISEMLSVVSRRTRLPEDAHPGSLLWYEPFIPLEDAALSTTLYYKYWGEDFQRQWWQRDCGITGYMGSFTLSP